MGKEPHNGGKILASRAIPEEPPEEQRGRVYSGDIGTPPKSEVLRIEPQGRGRKRKTKKRLSVFNVLLALAATSAIVLLYIYNTVRVGELLREIGDLDSEAQKLSNANEILKADINRKSTLERIGTIAQTELQLHHPQQQPIWFSLDSEAMRRAELVREREGVR
jgi:cell division protein FtsL